MTNLQIEERARTEAPTQATSPTSGGRARYGLWRWETGEPRTEQAPWFARMIVESFLDRGMLLDSDDEQHSCVLMYLTGFAGLPYGWDKGVARTCDGWLLFEGLRTSFSIRSQDVARYRRWLTLSPNHGRCSPTVCSDDGPVHLFIEDIGQTLRSEVSIRTVIDAWRNEAPAVGEPVWPARNSDPQAVWETIRAWRAGLFATITGLAVLAVALPFADPEWTLIVQLLRSPFPAAGFLSLIVGGFVLIPSTILLIGFKINELRLRRRADAHPHG